ncbi:hypothetical protein K501DRAFT_331750 [Backusella circina FSU 941]|nr:hypothetical protein K501DRAFT_331750 [Backusella circina FSU 941]
MFINMGGTAKVHFNIGSLFTVLNDHKRAITAFNRAIANDTYLAVAYLQRGVSLFLLGDVKGARDDFDTTYQYLRGNSLINYQQLGLHFKLYSCEVLFNRGISRLYLGEMDIGLRDLHHAQQQCKQQTNEQYTTIDEAVEARGVGFSVYSIPPGLLFRPSEFRLQQIKDWYGEHPLRKRKNSVMVMKKDVMQDQENINQPNNERQQRPYTNNKLKIKCYYTDTRILLVPDAITLEELKRRIGEKYDVSEMIELLYMTEEGDRKAIRDNSDLLTARRVGKKSRKESDSSPIEKLEIWIHLEKINKT